MSKRKKSCQRFYGDLESLTKQNKFYRRVLYTGDHMQLVLMKLMPGESIGLEVHNDTDQFFRIESGSAVFTLMDGGQVELKAKSGDAIIVPAGCWHNVTNNSKVRPLLLYTIYSPPHHPRTTLQRKK
jgi:mannose-6-phosphate isomerase-like protein (cupin superfamily)